MSVRYGLLGLLAGGEQHGYELKQAFEETSGGFWDINYGQIYITLDRLAEQELVEMHIEEGGEGKGHDRKVYSITPKGLRDFEEWLAKPVTKVRPLRDELFVKLSLMDADDPEPVLALIADQRQLYLARMADLTRKKQHLAKTAEARAGAQDSAGDGRTIGKSAFMTDLLVDAALFHAEADLRWLEHCQAKIRARTAQRESTGK